MEGGKEGTVCCVLLLLSGRTTIRACVWVYNSPASSAFEDFFVSDSLAVTTILLSLHLCFSLVQARTRTHAEQGDRSQMFPLVSVSWFLCRQTVVTSPRSMVSTSIVEFWHRHKSKLVLWPDPLSLSLLLDLTRGQSHLKQEWSGRENKHTAVGESLKC